MEEKQLHEICPRKGLKEIAPGLRVSAMTISILRSSSHTGTR